MLQIYADLGSHAAHQRKNHEVTAVASSRGYDDPKTRFPVRETWRGRGIGGALVEHSLAEFRRRGYAKAGLNVDPENETGAMRLYEKLGYRFDRYFGIYEKQL